MLCLWTTYKCCECSLSTSPATVGIGNPGLRTVPPEQRESTQGRRAASRYPGQTLQRHRSRPGLSLAQIYLHIHTFASQAGFLFTRSLPEKTKSCHSHRQLRRGGVHPSASLQPRLPRFQHLRCLLPRQSSCPGCHPCPGVAFARLGPPAPLLCTGAALASDPPVRQPPLPGLPFLGDPPGARARDRRAAPGVAGHLPCLSPGRLHRPHSPSCPGGPGWTSSQRGAQKGPGAAYWAGNRVGGSSHRAHAERFPAQLAPRSPVARQRPPPPGPRPPRAPPTRGPARPRRWAASVRLSPALPAEVGGADGAPPAAAGAGECVRQADLGGGEGDRNADTKTSKSLVVLGELPAAKGERLRFYPRRIFPKTFVPFLCRVTFYQRLLLRRRKGPPENDVAHLL